MKLALLGVTGRTGGAVAELALERGHDVVALARHPERLTLSHPRLQVVAGDAREAEAVARIVTGADAVVAALGPARGSFVLAAKTTGNVITAMRANGIRTLVVLSGAAMAVPGDGRASLRHRILIGLGRVLLGPVLRDKQAEIALLMATADLDWVHARPPRLTSGPGAVRYEANTLALVSTSIARRDLARFMLDQAERPTFVRQAPFVSA